MNRNHPRAYTFMQAWIPGLTDILFAVVFIIALASGAEMLSIDSDLGRHLTIGKYVLDHRIIPIRDLLSHTLSNQPRPPYEWLSQILFALANRFLGLDGVILFTALIIAFTFALVFQFAKGRCKSPMIAFSITFLAIGASSLHWLPRPHIITFLLFAIWVENLEQLRKGRSVKLLEFPLLMLFWANLHGGFVFGMLAWAAYFAGWIWTKWQEKADAQTGWKLLIVGFTSLTASVMTPDLWHNWEAVLNNRSAFILNRTGETMRPDLTNLSVLPFTILLAVTVVLFLMNYKTLAASHVFLILGLGTTSLLMARNIPLFTIACTPIVSELTKVSFSRLKTWNRIEERFATFRREPPSRLFPLAVMLLAVTYLAKHYFSTHQTIFQFNPQVFPVQAVDWLETHPQTGRMFNEFNWGGYILYRTWPQQLVFLDSQSDFYGEAFMMDYDQVISAQGDWEVLLERYEVSWAIIPPDLPLAGALKREGWKLLHEDPVAVILARK